ncbi:MAG TPA: hypothetical protein PLD40_08205, partial [Kiritimatiellia bacterium]|nr:hypothetical protein [Kiritimatiellia bacterium]
MNFKKWVGIGLLIGNAATAWAFPSWMGVYGSYTTHNGSNPGVYTILMNQDYWGLHAEVGILDPICIAPAFTQTRIIQG